MLGDIQVLDKPDDLKNAKNNMKQAFEMVSDTMSQANRSGNLTDAPFGCSGKGWVHVFARVRE
eukprot:5870749-Alexandrium_andersonii.AAC.1